MSRTVRRSPFIPDWRVALVLGLALFLAGSYVLWDAFEGRGKPTPRVLRPFTWT